MVGEGFGLGACVVGAGFGFTGGAVVLGATVVGAGFGLAGEVVLGAGFGFTGAVVACVVGMTFGSSCVLEGSVGTET